MLDLGAKLRDLRLTRGESLQVVADKVQVSKAHLWEVEAGKTKNPSVDLVRRLANHFDVTVGWLIGEAPDVEVEDQESLVLYRAVRELPADDKQLLRSIVESMKRRRKSGA